MAEGLGIKIPDKIAATTIYLNIFDPVPYELVDVAVNKIWRTWKKNTLPKPADLLEVIGGELRTWGEPERVRPKERPRPSLEGTPFEVWHDLTGEEQTRLMVQTAAELENKGDPFSRQLASFTWVFLDREARKTAADFL